MEFPITPHELLIRALASLLIAINVAAWIVADLQALKNKKPEPPTLASDQMPKVNWYTVPGGNYEIHNR